MKKEMTVTVAVALSRACWMAGIMSGPPHAASLIPTRTSYIPFHRMGTGTQGKVSQSPSVTQLIAGRARNVMCEETGIALMT